MCNNTKDKLLHAPSQKCWKNIGFYFKQNMYGVTTGPQGCKDATTKETQQWELNWTCFIKEETHWINNSMCNRSSVVWLAAWVHMCVVLSALTKAQINPNWETASGRRQIARDKWISEAPWGFWKLPWHTGLRCIRPAIGLGVHE